MSNMFTDPLFLLGSFGITMSVISWIKFNLDENNDEPFLIKYLSFISLISAIALLLSFFYNSGDLGIVLLVGAIVSFFVMLHLCLPLCSPFALLTCELYWCSQKVLFRLYYK